MKKAFNWKAQCEDISLFRLLLWDSCYRYMLNREIVTMPVTLDDAVVGHLPREFSHVAFYFLPVRLQEAGGSLRSGP